MSARDRNPPETPEGPAWELFIKIRRLEEKDEQGRGSNEPLGRVCSTFMPNALRLRPAAKDRRRCGGAALRLSRWADREPRWRRRGFSLPPNLS